MFPCSPSTLYIDLAKSTEMAAQYFLLRTSCSNLFQYRIPHGTVAFLQFSVVEISHEIIIVGLLTAFLLAIFWTRLLYGRVLMAQLFTSTLSIITGKISGLSNLQWTVPSCFNGSQPTSHIILSTYSSCLLITTARIYNNNPTS